MQKPCLNLDQEAYRSQRVKKGNFFGNTDKSNGNKIGKL